MDIVTGNVGWIEVICGPMFSGKSEERHPAAAARHDRSQAG
jgi:thymidine kinase